MLSFNLSISLVQLYHLIHLRKLKFIKPITLFELRVEKLRAEQENKRILYIVKSIGTIKSMPINAQEVDLSDQWDRQERRIEPCVTRWAENDLARTGHEGENEIAYWLDRRKLGAGEHERCKICNKYGELEIQVNWSNKLKLREES